MAGLRAQAVHGVTSHMWCKHCGQDVPAIGSSTTGAVRCARCGVSATDDASGVLAQKMPVGVTGQDGEQIGIPPVAESLPNLEDWDIEQSFRQLQARFGIDHRPARPTAHERSRDRAMHRIDAAHAALHGRHRRPPNQVAKSSVFAWSLLTAGLMTFTCGVALMGWSIFEGRAELWNVGMPLAAGGQLGIVLGLIVQLDKVWRNSRHTLEKLAVVDEQLDSLERTTNLLGMTHGSASQAFYAHMAEQANPHLLLADLKGQLDLLAMQISKRDE